MVVKEVQQKLRRHQGRTHAGFLILGGTKDYVRARTSRARNPKSITAGVQSPLKGTEISKVLDALWASILSILIQNGIEKIVDQSLGGGACACCAPLDPPLGIE